MTFINVIIGVCLAVYFSLYIWFAAKTGQFRKTVFWSVVAGLFALAAASLAAPFVHFLVPINWWTLGVSAAMSLPGVVGVLFCLNVRKM